MTKNSDRPLTLDDLDPFLRKAFNRSVRSSLIWKIAGPGVQLKLMEWDDNRAHLSKINAGQVVFLSGRSYGQGMRCLRANPLLTEHKWFGRSGKVRSVEFSLRRDLLDMIAAEVTHQALAKGLKIGEVVTL